MSAENEPVIELINPDGGYTKDNVIIVSLAASELLASVSRKERKIIMDRAVAYQKAAKA